MLKHMKRTTVRLDDDLMHQAKQSAAKRGITLTALIEEAIRERLARKPAGESGSDVVLPSFGSPDGRVAAGFDVADNAAVREFLDGGVPFEQLR